MSDTQNLIAAIWADVLGVDAAEVGATANFFELGGDSILVTVMVMQVEDALKIVIDPEAVYEHPRLDAFIARIQTPAAAVEE